MLIRVWVNIIFLLIAAYGAGNVIAGKNYIAPTWQYYFYLLSPWVLLLGSMKAWHRCFTWRRMTAAKNISPRLSRGYYEPLAIKQRPSILERACMVLLLMAIAAILKQLGLVN